MDGGSSFCSARTCTTCLHTPACCCRSWRAWRCAAPCLFSSHHQPPGMSAMTYVPHPTFVPSSSRLMVVIGGHRGTKHFRAMPAPHGERAHNTARTHGGIPRRQYAAYACVRVILRRYADATMMVSHALTPRCQAYARLPRARTAPSPPSRGAAACRLFNRACHLPGRNDYLVVWPCLPWAGRKGGSVPRSPYLTRLFSIAAFRGGRSGVPPPLASLTWAPYFRRIAQTLCLRALPFLSRRHS